MFPPGPAQQPDKERYAILYSAAKHTEARSWALAAMDPVLKALLGFDAASDFTALQARKVISLYLEHNKNEAGEHHPIGDEHVALLMNTFPDRNSRSLVSNIEWLLTHAVTALEQEEAGKCSGTDKDDSDGLEDGRHQDRRAGSQVHRQHAVRLHLLLPRALFI